MTEEKLVRGIGRWDLTAIAINTIIGTGIFILPAGVFALIGSFSLLAFVACAVIVGLIVLCFSEVSSRFKTTGGMYLYAKAAFGPEIGFEVGWLYWVGRVATFAANCNAVVLYLGFFFAGLDSGLPRIAVITIVVVGITVVNLLGVRESAMLTNVFTIGKLVPLLLFVAVGLFFVEPANFDFSTVPDHTSFPTAVLLLIYAYVGFEAAVIPAGEIKDPGRNVPFALLTALGFCVILFFLIQLVAIGTLPGLAESKTPLADAAGRFAGSIGGAFIAVGALVSVLGNLNSGFLASSRIPFAMAEQRELPRVLAKTHKKYKTPFLSIILTGAVILGLTIFTSFLTAVTIVTITRLLVYATTCLALPVFRQRGDVPPARFSAPTGILAATLSIGLITWLMMNVDYAKEGLAVLIAAVVGMIIFMAYRLLRGNRDETPSAIGEL
ncbi:MAG: amino acid permease [Chloracidobacterium sp.]|nr:amino acid permease [Chloracidobacterium sp.]